MTLQPKTFNIQHPTPNNQVTDAGKPGGSALNVECSMFVREISRRATIWTDSRVAAGILPPGPKAVQPDQRKELA
jgi:hypothetical protein